MYARTDRAQFESDKTVDAEAVYDSMVKGQVRRVAHRYI